MTFKSRFNEDKVKQFCRYALADDMESGQSQFAPLKLRSLALVPSSGARCAPPNSTPASSAVRLFPTRRSASVIDSRALRGPASPVCMRPSVDQWKEVPMPAAVQSSGQPSAGLSPPGRFAPFPPIKGKRSQDCAGTSPPQTCAGSSPTAPRGHHRPGGVVPVRPSPPQIRED